LEEDEQQPDIVNEANSDGNAQDSSRGEITRNCDDDDDDDDFLLSVLVLYRS
jgi:hypothetical protein